MFTSKKLTKTSIKTKAEGALGMFYKAITQLKDANEESATLEEDNDVQITILSLENDELSKNRIKNEAIIGNIEKLIGK